MAKTGADLIRQFVDTYYVTPARQKGSKQITIRAGDVHTMMGLKSRMPAVCGAIGSMKFEKEARPKLVQRTGPTNAANVNFTFEILP